MPNIRCRVLPLSEKVLDLMRKEKAPDAEVAMMYSKNESSTC